jgi:hypothetical protein
VKHFHISVSSVRAIEVKQSWVVSKISGPYAEKGSGFSWGWA